MLKTIERIREFGVFDDYSWSSGTSEFAEKNVIYGWNYSGKTTLSRLIGCLSTKKLPAEQQNAKFAFRDSAGSVFTESNLSSFPYAVAIFNSDFTRENLSWDGVAFQPILLLGDESITATKKLEKFTARVQACFDGSQRKLKTIAAIDQAISEGKTTCARQIKSTLSIVEAFTATHLNQLLAALSIDDGGTSMSEAEVSQYMAIALTQEKDKLPPTPRLSVKLSLDTLAEEATKLLSHTPALSNTISHLQSHPEISEWVETGLGLHEHKVGVQCEFCGNLMSKPRLDSLVAHFSKDLVNHKEALRLFDSKLAAAIVSNVERNATEVNGQFRVRFQELKQEINSLIDKYNAELADIRETVNQKQRAPFQALEAMKPASLIQATLHTKVEALNELISESNRVSENFTSEKKKAVELLKLHFASQFLIDFRIKLREKQKLLLRKHVVKYERITGDLQQEIDSLNASINRAQRGRERINQRIAHLLGSERLQISVIRTAVGDQFQLVRDSTVARNLSEGEKTAISFAFFLTKLEENVDLTNVIVYVDDPISSLDSNHIFQVFSMIKTTFFCQENGQADSAWTTTCRQLFISTHNFEFFSLLRRLPCKKSRSRYYMVRRDSPSTSTLTDMPASILKHSSEYHYLFRVIHDFHTATDKGNLERLLALPNAVRRFLELYTYSKIPKAESNVEDRAAELFGSEQALRITKVLHHFSHLESIERISANTDLIADIENVVNDVVVHLQGDRQHYEALLSNT